jgi:hypothetical protein
VPAAKWEELFAAAQINHEIVCRNIDNLIYAGVPRELHAQAIDLLRNPDQIVENGHLALFYQDLSHKLAFK